VRARYPRTQRELVAIFGRFTDAARASIAHAQDESQTRGDDHIGTEHLLLGVLRSGDPSARVFAEAGVSLEAARAELQPAARSREATAGQIPFTADAKHVLEMSLREAMALDHDYISCPHIALALLDERGGSTARIVRALGADPDELRDRLAILVMDQDAAPRRQDRPVRFIRRAMSRRGTATGSAAAATATGSAEFRAERDLLADGLRRYGRHEDGCPAESGTCSCGLTQLLAIAESRPEQA
jgi:ATP-dependent Clp protease ATP-binding subunit ClpA